MSKSKKRQQIQKRPLSNLEEVIFLAGRLSEQERIALVKWMAVNAGFRLYTETETMQLAQASIKEYLKQYNLRQENEALMESVLAVQNSFAQRGVVVR